MYYALKLILSSIEKIANILAPKSSNPNHSFVIFGAKILAQNAHVDEIGSMCQFHHQIMNNFFI